MFCFSSFYAFILILILALYVNNKYLGALLGMVDSSTMETRKLCVYHRREGGERSVQCGGGRRETHEDQGAEHPGESQPSSTQFCLRTKEQPQQPSHENNSAESLSSEQYRFSTNDLNVLLISAVLVTSPFTGQLIDGMLNWFSCRLTLSSRLLSLSIWLLPNTPPLIYKTCTACYCTH